MQGNYFCKAIILGFQPAVLYVCGNSLPGQSVTTSNSKHEHNHNLMWRYQVLYTKSTIVIHLDLVHSQDSSLKFTLNPIHSIRSDFPSNLCFFFSPHPATPWYSLSISWIQGQLSNLVYSLGFCTQSYLVLNKPYHWPASVCSKTTHTASPEPQIPESKIRKSHTH